MPAYKEEEENLKRVIDDNMLLEGIQLDKYKKAELEETYGTGKISVVDLASTADVLLLSFNNIAKIENLVGLENLTKLCLDNNHIEEIINLESLKRLKWLDLSFNKITKIQGLSALSELEDLSLFSNRITTIEELEHCPKLKCVSIGNNKIDSLEYIVRFRQLPELRMLTLAGNPICEEADYRMTVFAYVSNLKYLDYAVVDAVDVATAKEQYHDELLDIEEKESVILEKVQRDKTNDAYVAQLDEASILFAYSLFGDMFNDDTEIEKLRHLPGIKEAIDAMKAQFKTQSDEFISVAMEKYALKSKEINFFNKAVQGVREKDDKECAQLIESFNASKKISSELIQEADNKERTAIVKRLTEEMDKVCDELMSIEIRQVGKYEVLVDEFENKITEMKAEALEMQNTFFRAIEKMEEDFAGTMRNIAVDLIERFTREELTEDYLDEEAMSLVQDREACMTVISASHDIHVGKLLKKEDEARAVETRKTQGLVNDSNEKERFRNRDHVLQIHDFSKNAKIQLNSLLGNDEDDDNED